MAPSFLQTPKMIQRYNHPMRIQPKEDDAIEFIAAVNGVMDGLLSDLAPRSLYAVKIDNWFGPKRLGFAGKFPIGSAHSKLSIIGVPDFNPDLRIPPFVPSRVVSQHKFAGYAYKEVDPGEPLHIRISSNLARRRSATGIAPGAALIWYSGNSKSSGRGSLMAYLPDANRDSAWHAEWSSQPAWQLSKTVGITQSELLKMMESRSAEYISA